MTIASVRTVLVCISAFMLFATPRSAAQTAKSYCAFEVTIHSAKGLPASNVPVSLLDHQGRVFNTVSTDSLGTARICDVPSGLVDVEVGGQLCGAVLVRNLKPYWMKTRVIAVTYENCSGDDFFVSEGCLLVLRVRNEQGEPLGGVLLEGDQSPKPREQTSSSDNFGRIFRFIDYGDALKATLIKKGYISKVLTIGCLAGESFEKEQAIVMEHKEIQR